MAGASGSAVARGRGSRGRGPLVRYIADEAGVVFLAAVLAVGVLFALVTSVSSLASGEAQATPYWQDKGEAFYTAESGLNHCLWKLTYEGDQIAGKEGQYGVDPPTFTSWSEDESAGVLRAGTGYQVWVLSDATDPNCKYVTVLAEVNGRSHLLRATVRQSQGSPFYDEDGDGVAEAGDSGTVTYPNLPNLGVLHVTANQKVRIGPGEFLYDAIRIEGRGELILDGQTTLWVRQSVKVEGDSKTNVPPPGQERPTYNLIIFIPPLTEEDGVKKQTVDISGNALFYGFIYAPGAKVQITGNSDVYGMVVGEEVTVTGSTTYDPEGENITWPASTKTDYIVESWDG